MEWLMELLQKYGIPEEKIQEIAQGEKELKMIPKSRLDEVNQKANGLAEQLAQRDKDLADLAKKTKGDEDLETKLTTLQNNYKAEKENLEKELAQTRFDNGVTVELLKSQARDVAAVKAMLDLSKITAKEDGSLSGLTEQLEALKQEKAWAFGGEQKTQYTPKDGQGASEAFHFDFNGIRPTPNSKGEK